MTASKQQQDIQDQLWGKARQYSLSILTRPSYRSILALLLFTLTERPVDYDEPGLTHLCTQAMLGHFVRLRSSLELPVLLPLCGSTSATPSSHEALDSIIPKKRPFNDSNRQHLQDSMFWLGVLVDTSRALINQTPSVILPGNSGEKEVWSFIRKRTIIFDQSFNDLHASLPLSPEVVAIVLQHASACKTMYLGTLNQFSAAVFHQSTESVADTAQRVSEESQRFHDVFDRLLALCASDYLTMNAENQIHYCELASSLRSMSVYADSTVLLLIHYNLGSLILADIIGALKIVPEPLADPTSIRLQACNAIVNTLTLTMSYDKYSDETPCRSRLLHDPTPELMVEVLSRAGKAILLMFHTQKTQALTAQIMLCVIVDALNILSSISKTASYVLSSLTHSISFSSLKVKSESPTGNNGPTAKPEQIQHLSTCGSDSIDEFLQETQIQADIDQLHLDKTIAKHEQIKKISTLMTRETQNMDDLFSSTSSTLEGTVSSAFQASLGMANWTPSPN